MDMERRHRARLLGLWTATGRAGTPTDAAAILCLFVGLCSDADLPAPCSNPSHSLGVSDWDGDGSLTPIDASATLGMFVGLFSAGATPLGALCGAP